MAARHHILYEFVPVLSREDAQARRGVRLGAHVFCYVAVPDDRIALRNGVSRAAELG